MSSRITGSLIVVAALAAPVLSAQANQTYAFVNATVIPMNREGSVAGQTVVVRGDRIAEVGPSARVRVPEGAVRIEAAGKFLMPGLAEMHAHIPPQQQATDQEILRVLELYALNGVTTVRGMLGVPRHIGFRARAAAGEILSPRIWTSGPSFNGNSVPSPDSAARMVRAEKALGYDFLKVHPGVSRAAFDSLDAAADQVGIRYAGHVPLAVGLRRAIEARYWTIDHIDGFVEAMVDHPPATPQEGGFFGLAVLDRVQESRLPALVSAMKAAGVWVVPTSYFFEAITGDDPVETLAARPDMRHIPAPVVQNWSTITTQIRTDTPREQRARFIALRRRVLTALHDGGVGIALGSDSPQFWNAPGFSVARELSVYVAAGLTPWQALATGTRNVAQLLGNSAEAGSVEAGKRADLLLLDADPLRDVTNVSRTAGVMVGGRWVPKDEIERRLAALVLR